MSIRLETSQYLEKDTRDLNIGVSAANKQDSADHDELVHSHGDEWEGEVVEEVVDGGTTKFKVAWVPTLEPAENLGVEMRKAWEEKKASSVLATQRNEARMRSRVGKCVTRNLTRPRKAITARGNRVL
jgi:hypothetical protein